MICSDPMAVHIMSVMNRHMYGRENILIREDMLCAMWSLKREEQIQYWPVRPLYERYRQEGWQSILPEISSGLEESDKKKDVSFTEESLSYAVCRGHMRIQPVNYERHRHTLENAIHRKIGDIALVLQLIICEGNPDNLTMQLSRNRIMTWERTEDQLIMEAFMNSSRKMPPRLYLGSDRRPGFPYYEGVFLPDEKGRPTKIAPWNALCEFFDCQPGAILSYEKEIDENSILFKLREEQEMKLKGGLYHQTQIRMACMETG